MSLAWRAFVVSSKVVACAIVLATPLAAVWIASSLAAYVNGPVALAVACGALLFPLLPLAWEALAAQRRRLAAKARPRWLTFFDRLVLRTLILNVAFLSAMLAIEPETAFAAISTRGDWMLDGRSSRAADTARRALFRCADALAWLYDAAHDNPYKDPKESAQESPTPTTLPTSAPAPATTAAPAPRAEASTRPASTGDAPTASASAWRWPAASALHPVVAQMPASEETSIAAVARYLSDRVRDPIDLAKAVHDWVADRVAYDAPSYAAHRYPPQDAATVFRDRKGVCAGYSRLFVAVAKAAGLEAVYVHGDARAENQRETGEPHAWNAVKIDGAWRLVDVTWDAGFVDGATFTKRYRSDFFLTPPEVFGVDHFPAEPKWQLRSEPILRGDFFRQPMMAPRFFAEQRELVSPDRSQVTVRGPLTITMKNPRGLFTLASVLENGAKRRCAVEDGPLVTITCDLPNPGAFEVHLYSNEARYGDYAFIGEVEVNREP